MDTQKDKSSPGTLADLFFQLSVPISAGWGAVGIGGGMSGALMFIIYPDSKGHGKEDNWIRIKCIQMLTGT